MFVRNEPSCGNVTTSQGFLPFGFYKGMVFPARAGFSGPSAGILDIQKNLASYVCFLGLGFLRHLVLLAPDIAMP